ncbi:pyrimidine-specific ribonucleoside hydrolase RihA [soil metagenome]
MSAPFPSGGRPIILDCDPGHDDALAILLALARPELRLLGITTVGGNAPLEATTLNALRVLTLAGRTDIPVAPGADRPLCRPLRVAAQVHGASGLEGAELPEPAVGPDPRGAVELMAQLVRESDAPVTLVPTGPLTNIAIFLAAHPELHSRIERICLMGGAMGEGNWTASAEFNIWVDPEAAVRVFDSGLPLTMIGIDVTHQAVVPVSQTDRLADIGNHTGRVFAELFRFFGDWHARRYGWDGSPIHDAVAVGHAALGDLVETRPYRVDVEVTSELTLGRTVVDREGLSGKPANAEVGVSIDRERFVEMVFEAIARFP